MFDETYGQLIQCSSLSIHSINKIFPIFSILILIILTLPILSMEKKGIVYGKERQAELSCEIPDSTTTHFPE